MTNEEIRAMSRVVAQHFGLWTPEQLCRLPLKPFDADGDDVTATRWFWCSQHGDFRELETSHEIPCPDLTEPAWSDTLGDALPVDEILFHRFDKGWCCQLFMVFDVRPNEWSDDSWGPTKRESLLLAAYQLAQREAPNALSSGTSYDEAETLAKIAKVEAQCKPKTETKSQGE